MEPSGRNLSAAVVVVVLLVMSADMARVQAEGNCYYASGTFHGWCLWPPNCEKTCRKESSPTRPGQNYDGGVCIGGFDAKCYCSEPCSKVLRGATAHGDQAVGARGHD
ncbi:hypothetical protein EJB05_23571 [Eragrostis curvula]|uniref:Knottin scorpion toxin-like domain-containing protein n=1 Tax=Eragrostis curvula TaxID=38414 RepID=A0A5J9V8E1_9POAL|nr:hypothetical protein EJB05_23571 [Eragrostis curvula]